MARMQEPPSQGVIWGVAALTGTDPLELPPLYDAVDPGALDAVVDGLDRGSIRFSYAGFDVTVAADGTVDLAAHPQVDAVRAEDPVDE